MKSRRVNAKKYVVLDVETNGLSSLRDDLLSISIFQPDTGKMFNKFLPLEKDHDVYTTHINGITKLTLEGATPLTQQDVDNLILEYDLEKRRILTYGNIDEKFIKNYFKRKKLDGFQKLHFFNFKRSIISSRFSGGNVTKDNLCKVYGMENVPEKHTGVSDCLLEWELFKKMDNKKLLVTQDNVFEFNEEYVIPISYLSTYPNFKYHITGLPYISFASEEVKRFEIAKEAIKKFPTNFNGMLIEHLVTSMLSAEIIDSSEYLVENKSKLKYIGRLPSIFDEILMNFKSDGTVRAVKEKDKKIEEELNSFLLLLKQEITPLISYIAKDIFSDNKIYSQELVIHQNENLLALCDLSSKSAVLEIKAYGNLEIDRFKEQLYYQSNGRDCYVLQVDWSKLPKRVGFIVSKVTFTVGGSCLEPRAERYRQKVLSKSDGIVEISDYIGSKDTVSAKCTQCNFVWSVRADHLLRRPFCPECKRGPEAEVKNELSLTPSEQVKEKKEFRAQRYYTKINDRSGGNIKVVKYHGSKDDLTAQCLECGNEWNIRADHLASRPYCPLCKRSTKK